MKSFKEVRQELAVHGSDTLREMPCRWCGKLASIGSLNTYGARCFKCYEAYCQVQPDYTDTGNKNDSPKAWAHALKRREENGERLSSVQKAMWRAALDPRDPLKQEDTHHPRLS